MAVAVANGAKLWYELRGEGEPMVMLGGSGFGRHNVEPLIPFLERHFTLLLFDQRGYGESESVGLSSPSIEVWADDVPALMDEVGWDRAHINATSFGGMVALAVGIRHPERCLSITTQGFFAKPDVTRKLMLEAWDDHSKASGLGRGFACHIATDALSPAFLEAHPEVIDQITAMLADTRLETWHAAHHAMQTLDLTDGLAGCSVPTLVIAGEADWVTPLDMEASGVGMRRTAELMPNARLVVFAETGHVTILERTEEHARATIEFLRSLG